MARGSEGAPVKLILLATALAGTGALCIHLRERNTAQEELARRILETDAQNRILFEAMKQGVREGHTLFSTAPLYPPKPVTLPTTEHFRSANAN